LVSGAVKREGDDKGEWSTDRGYHGRQSEFVLNSKHHRRAEAITPRRAARGQAIAAALATEGMRWVLLALARGGEWGARPVPRQAVAKVAGAGLVGGGCPPRGCPPRGCPACGRAGGGWLGVWGRRRGGTLLPDRRGNGGVARRRRRPRALGAAARRCGAAGGAAMRNGGAPWIASPSRCSGSQ
jgi:hypothetical protein